MYTIVNYGEVMDYSKPVYVIKDKLEDCSMSSYLLLMLKGMDVLAKQELDLKKAGGGGVDGGEVSVYAKVRHRIATRSLTYALILNLGFLILWFVALVTTLRFHAEREEWNMFAFAVGSLATSVGITMASATTTFYINCSQILFHLDVKRLQHDIRTCNVKDSVLIVPRVNGLLKQLHGFTNSTHKFFFMWLPIVACSWIMLVIALYNLNIVKDLQYRVPCWIIIASVQPVGSLLSFYHGFASLNLILERDLDNDLNDLQLRIRCAEGMRFQWGEVNAAKIQCLLQRDSKVCILPFHIIPDVQTTKLMVSYIISLAVLLLPYMINNE